MSIQQEVLRGPFAGTVVVRRTICDIVDFTVSWLAYCGPSSPTVTRATGFSRTVIGYIQA